MPFAQLYMIEGRTPEMKKAVIEKVSAALQEATGAKMETIRVWITEFDADERVRDFGLDERALRGVAVFEGLADAEIAHLARATVRNSYASGEAIVFAGDPGASMFVVVSGEAAVFLEDNREVARIQPGGFFGEMSLLTGAPRRATIIAATDLECFRLDKASLENERNAVWIRAGDADVTCVQIAGLIARRILCYVKAGDAVAAGDRFGFIRFGSRVDTYLPLQARAKVALGDKVHASSTVMAVL